MDGRHFCNVKTTDLKEKLIYSIELQLNTKSAFPQNPKKKNQKVRN